MKILLIDREGEIIGKLRAMLHGKTGKPLIDKKTGGPVTAHSTNPVPLVMVGAEPGLGLQDGGTLTNIAPTILALMGLPIPAEMESASLLVLDEK